MTQPDACDVCGDALTTTGATVEAQHGTVAAVVEHAPYRACPRQHRRRELRAGFPDDLVAAVREGLVSARRPRWPRRGQRCGVCGDPLTMPGRRTTRSVTVNLADVPPFTVTMDLPALRCPGCAADNLPHEAGRDVAAAVRAALDRRWAT